MKYANYLLFIKFKGNYKFCMDYLLNRVYLHFNNPVRFQQDIECIENIQELIVEKRLSIAA